MITQATQTPTYFTQRNNKYGALRACFPTSLAMMMINAGVEYNPSELMGLGIPDVENIQFDDLLMWLCNNHPSVLEYAKTQGIPLAQYTDGDPNVFSNGDHLNEWFAVCEYTANLFLELTNQPFKVSAKYFGNYTLAATEVCKKVQEGYMTVVGTMLTHAGHMVCIGGYTDNKEWLVYDPYGDATKYYQDANGNGIIIPMNNFPGMVFQNILTIRKT